MSEVISLFSGLAVKEVFETSLLPAFTASSGIDVVTTFEPTSELLHLISSGSTPGVIVGVSQALSTLADNGDIDPASLTPMIRSGIGLAVAPRAPHPSIATTAELVNSLRRARAVAYSRTGASGVYFASLLRHLGIAKEVDERAVILEKGFVAEALIDGRADIAVQQLIELAAVKQAEIVGPLPEDVQSYIELSAAVGAGAASPAAVRLVDFLCSAEAAERYAQVGLNPPATGPGN